MDYRAALRRFTADRGAPFIGAAFGIYVCAAPGAAHGDPVVSLSDAGATAVVELAVPKEAEDGLKSELRVIPSLEFSLPKSIRLKMIGRFRADATDHFEPGVPDDNSTDPISRHTYLGDQAEMELREFYAQIPLGDVFLTLGKQQIVWGKADGLKLLDVVNPQSFREFILPEFDESRIPLWSVNAETRIRDIDLQFILIPEQTYHEIPKSDSPFAITSPRFVPPGVPGVPVTQLPANRPSRTLADADAGVRASTFLGGWDLSLLYFFHYEDIPAPNRQITRRGVIVQPEYDRAHLIGGAASKAFGDLTLRAEAGYTVGRALAVGDQRDADGVNESDVVAGVVGLDWSGFGDVFVSIQLFQDYVLNEPFGLYRPEADTTTTLFLRRKYMNDTVSLELRWLSNVNDGDGLIRPKAVYDLNDAVQVWVGADVFYGDGDGLFGQFRRNDRAVLGMSYGF